MALFCMGIGSLPDGSFSVVGDNVWIGCRADACHVHTSMLAESAGLSKCILEKMQDLLQLTPRPGRQESRSSFWQLTQWRAAQGYTSGLCVILPQPRSWSCLPGVNFL